MHMLRKRNIIILLFISFALWGVSPSFAVDGSAYDNSGLPIPRFVSLRSEKVFVRTGPALRYPIKWIFVKEGLPVEVLQEFDTWRKIRDVDGAVGWIHQSLLSGKRNAIVIEKNEAYLVRKPVTGSQRVALLEPNVTVVLEQCSGAWCEVEAHDYEGWIEKKALWGIYEDEELD